MSNYIGIKCPVCGKKFSGGDDIVVCPACGAPHHRACYAQNNECAFAADHINGKEWRPPSPEPRFSDVHDSAGTHTPPDSGNPPGLTTCPACGASNLSGAVFCQICGRRVGGHSAQGYYGPGETRFPWTDGGSFDSSRMIYGDTLSPDETIDGETVRDLSLYIGQNSVYYLPRFRDMDSGARVISFNISALLFNFVFFFYRKMYVVGAFLLGLFIVGSIPGFLLAGELLPEVLAEFGFSTGVPLNQAAIDHYNSLDSMVRTINFSLGFVLSFLSNKIYFLKAVADVKKIRENRGGNMDERDYAASLSGAGGVSKNAAIVAVASVCAAFFLVGTVLSYLSMRSMLI